MKAVCRRKVASLSGNPTTPMAIVSELGLAGLYKVSHDTPVQPTRADTIAPHQQLFPASFLHSFASYYICYLNPCRVLLPRSVVTFLSRSSSSRRTVSSRTSGRQMPTERKILGRCPTLLRSHRVANGGVFSVHSHLKLAII